MFEEEKSSWNMGMEYYSLLAEYKRGVSSLLIERRYFEIKLILSQEYRHIKTKILKDYTKNQLKIPITKFKFDQDCLVIKDKDWVDLEKYLVELENILKYGDVEEFMIIDLINKIQDILYAYEDKFDMLEPSMERKNQGNPDRFG